jgi:putative flippase GtrA
MSPSTNRWAEASWSLIRRIHLGTRRPDNWVKLFKFGLVGVSGYVVNLLVFTALTEHLDLGHISAAVLSFCAAVTNNFVWNSVWTFRESNDTQGRGFRALRFLAISVGALGVNILVLVVLVDGLGMPAVAGQAIGVAVAMPVNFIGNKLWTFEPA